MEDTKNDIFLVTGATGTVGRQAVRELLKNGKRVRVLSRSAQKPAFSTNVEVINGDLNKAETLIKAFEGIYAAHYISIGDEKYTPLPNGRSIVELAEQSGIKRVTILWNGEGNESSLETEIKQSSLDGCWTIFKVLSLKIDSKKILSSLNPLVKMYMMPI